MSISIPPTVLDKFTTFGDLLRFLRRRVGITQLELATAVGYSDTQISRLEQNQRPPDIPTIEARFISALDLEHEPKAVSRLLDLAANVKREDAPGLGLCPFKGLNYFDEADADLFVGREQLTARLMEHVLSLVSSRSPNGTRFLAVVGSSGSGKSSLVRAGLVSALRWHKKSIDWQIHILTPTAHPLESLATSLTLETTSVSSTATLIDDLKRDERSLHLFAKRKLQTGGNPYLLLVVDQFEEVFALCRSEEEKDSFIGNLLRAASEAEGPVIVLITLRADFYAHCAKFHQLRETLAMNQEYIGAMSSDELRRAIEEPAHRGRWEIEPGLVDVLLRDVGHEPGALPLLSHALMETWQRRRGRMMTLGGYASSGGVYGAIAETAETVFTDQFTREQQLIARRIFLRLTELGDDTSAVDTRRRANLDELILRPEENDVTRAVLKSLADARLITLDEDSAEVAHEALIREWPALQGWLEENRDGLRLQRQLTETAKEWLVMERTPDLLYRGIRLDQAREWASTHEEELNVLEYEFLAASIEAVEGEAAEKEAQRQRELEAAKKLAESEKQRAEEQTIFARQLSRRAMYLTGAFIVALLMAFTALYFGSQARQTAVSAQNDRRIATARELAAASLNNLDVDPERSILLALQSVSTTRSADGTVLPESVEALHLSIVSSPIRMTLDGHDTGVLSTDYSPDGSRLATIGNDGTVIIWDALTGGELIRMAGTTEPNDFVTTQRVAYSPDGKLLVAGDRNQIRVFDAASGNLIESLDGHKADVTSIAFSIDGRFIASGGFDGSAIVWDISMTDSHMELIGHEDAIENLTFSPDGKWLVTTSNDATMKIWDVHNGYLLQDFTDFTGVVLGATFSPDGKLFAFSDESIHLLQFSTDRDADPTGISSRELLTIPNAISETFSPDGSRLAGIRGNDIKIWDALTGRELYTFTGHIDWVMGLAFSPDGRSLASTSLDGTVKIWSLSPGNETVAVLATGAVYGNRVTYNPNGEEFITSSGDGTTTTWNAETGEPRLTVHGHHLEVLNVSFSHDGKYFATGSLDGSTIIWDSRNGSKLLTLVGHEDGVRDAAFSFDGSLIATGGFDGTAKVWDAKTGTLIHEIAGHQGLVLGVAFSPDGAHLATSSTDATAKIWDTKTGELIFTLTGHETGIRDISFSPGGAMIATASGDGTAILWDAKSSLPIRTLVGHTSALQAIAFSPDGKWLGTGSEDNTAKVWEVETGREIISLPGSMGGVFGIAFSPSDNGAHLAISSGDGMTRIFLLKIDELLALARSRATRSLTVEECKKYLHVEQCP